jgi:hypothetical protein
VITSLPTLFTNAEASTLLTLFKSHPELVIEGRIVLSSYDFSDEISRMYQDVKDLFDDIILPKFPNYFGEVHCREKFKKICVVPKVGQDIIHLPLEIKGGSAEYVLFNEEGTESDTTKYVVTQEDYDNRSEHNRGRERFAIDIYGSSCYIIEGNEQTFTEKDRHTCVVGEAFSFPSLNWHLQEGTATSITWLVVRPYAL